MLASTTAGFWGAVEDQRECGRQADQWILRIGHRMGFAEQLATDRPLSVHRFEVPGMKWSDGARLQQSFSQAATTDFSHVCAGGKLWITGGLQKQRNARKK